MLSLLLLLLLLLLPPCSKVDLPKYEGESKIDRETGHKTYTKQ
jgi:hypothetical protein